MTTEGSRWWRPVSGGWRDPAICLAITLAYTWFLLATVDTLGYARDEGFYFEAAKRYQQWFALLWQDSARALASSAGSASTSSGSTATAGIQQVTTISTVRAIRLKSAAPRSRAGSPVPGRPA